MVATLENYIPHGGGHVLTVSALDTIGKNDGAALYLQASGGWDAGGRRVFAAGSGIAVLILELRAAAGTLEGQIAGPQALQCGDIEFPAVALANGFAIPFHAEGMQSAQDAVGGARDLARPIEILDSYQPTSPVRPGVEEARRRGIERAQVQIARGRRGESADVGRRFSGTGRRGRRIASRGARAAPALRPTGWRPAGLPAA